MYELEVNGVGFAHGKAKKSIPPAKRAMAAQMYGICLVESPIIVNTVQHTIWTDVMAWEVDIHW